MRRITTILLGLAVITLAACTSSGYKKTKSGLIYKIMSDKGAPPAKRGNWLKMHIKQRINDSVLGQSYGQMPIYIQADSMPAVYDPREILYLLRKGDSAVVVMLADSIAKKQGGLPEYLKRKDKLIFTFKVLEAFTNDSLKMADETAEGSRLQAKMAAEAEGKKASTEKEIEDYLASNNIKYEKAPGGTYVVVTNPGTDPKADTGYTAAVKYKGTLFKTDRIFDQNMQPDRQPYPVRVGTAGVVKGWEEGLPYFGKGGKGVLYVPFWQGYGAQGPMNTPYATMVFDIEVVDVRQGEAPPAGAPPVPQQ